MLQAKYDVLGARVTMIENKAHSFKLWQGKVMANALFVKVLKVRVENGDSIFF